VPEFREYVRDMLIECDLLQKSRLLLDIKKREDDNGMLFTAVWSLEKIVQYLKAARKDLSARSPECEWGAFADMISLRLKKTKESGNLDNITETVCRLIDRAIPPLKSELEKIREQSGEENV
jgi:hypothetical protein